MSRNDPRQVPRLWGWAKISYTVLYTDAASSISDCAASLPYVICGKTLDYASIRMFCIIVATSLVVEGFMSGYVLVKEGIIGLIEDCLYVQSVSAMNDLHLHEPSSSGDTQAEEQQWTVWEEVCGGGFITLGDCGIIGLSDYRIIDSRCSSGAMIDDYNDAITDSTTNLRTRMIENDCRVDSNCDLSIACID